MAIYRVKGPDGKVYKIKGPEGASQEQVIQQAQKLMEQPSVPQDDSRMRGFAFGAYKPLENLTSAAMNIPGMKEADRWMSDTFGTTPYNEIVAERETGRKANTRRGYQLAGNVVGTLPTAAIPGGPIVQGAAAGGLLSDEKDVGGVATDMLIGGMAGKAGDMALKGASKLAKPYVSKGAEMLRDAGVPMTLGQLSQQAGSGGGKVGQLVGNSIRGMEDRLAGFPVIGDAIKGAQGRGMTAYNRALINRSLSAVGKSLPDDVPVGHDSIRYAWRTLSDGYKSLTPKLSATVDDTFTDGLRKAWDDIGVLPNAKQAQFRKIMDNVFVNRANGMTITGDAVKQVESRLSDLASKYASSSNADDQILGGALKNVLGEFRSLLERTNPKYADQLRALNAGWRDLAIIEKAATSRGNTTGVFTPKQYANAALMSDRSVRRSASARGMRKDQALTDAAADILPNNVPDSGTSGRLAAGMAGAGIMEPSVAIPAAAMLAPYSQTGQSLANSLFVGQRGPLAEGAAKLLEQSRRYAPGVIAPMIPYLDQ